MMNSKLKKVIKREYIFPLSFIIMTTISFILISMEGLKDYILTIFSIYLLGLSILSLVMYITDISFGKTSYNKVSFSLIDGRSFENLLVKDNEDYIETLEGIQYYKKYIVSYKKIDTLFLFPEEVKEYIK